MSDIQAECESQLYQFINLIRHKYIIENIFLILLSAVQNRQEAQNIKFNPIGMCEQLETLQNAADSGIFKAILESTPVSQYFQEADIDVDYFQNVQQITENRE